MELNYKKCGENYKRFLRVRANTWDAQEPAWKISMQKFQSMGSLMEDMNINENGRNQMKRDLRSSHLLYSSIQQDITVPLFNLLILNTAYARIVLTISVDKTSIFLKITFQRDLALPPQTQRRSQNLR